MYRVCDDWVAADHWAEGYASAEASPFKGMDMLAEPPPRWPAWLDRWDADARRTLAVERGADVATFSQALKDRYLGPVRAKLRAYGDLFTRYDPPVYRTPPAIEARVQARRAKRLDAEQRRGWYGGLSVVPIMENPDA